ncbi:MAG: hypothetical protein EOP93_12240, partial [Lysobacteraceae bacterium]
APLLSTPVWQDPLRFVVAPDHPLARRRKVALADLAAHPAVLPDAGTFTHRIVADAFARSGLSLQVRMTTNYMETVKMLATVGLAWSALPETMLDAQLQVLPVREVQLSRQLGTVVHGGRTLSRAAQAFIGLLEEEAARGHLAGPKDVSEAPRRASPGTTPRTAPAGTTGSARSPRSGRP